MLPVASFATFSASGPISGAVFSGLVGVTSPTVLALSTELNCVHFAVLPNVAKLGHVCNTSFLRTANVEGFLQFQLVVLAKQFFLSLWVLDARNKYLDDAFLKCFVVWELTLDGLGLAASVKLIDRFLFTLLVSLKFQSMDAKVLMWLHML